MICNHQDYISSLDLANQSSIRLTVHIGVVSVAVRPDSLCMTSDSEGWTQLPHPPASLLSWIISVLRSWARNWHTLQACEEDTNNSRPALRELIRGWDRRRVSLPTALASWSVFTVTVRAGLCWCAVVRLGCSAWPINTGGWKGSDYMGDILSL